MTPLLRRVASRDNPLLQRLRKLGGDPGAYRKLGELWLEGDHLCAAFIHHGGTPLQAVISEQAWDNQPGLRALARQAPLVSLLPPALMASITALESPSPLGYLIALPAFEALAVQALPSVVLDRLQDAGNVGAVLRSAAAFGIKQVLALTGTAALWSPKVLRAGMGAHFGLRLIERVDTAHAIAALQQQGLPLMAADPHAPQALHTTALPWPCAWVLGHEGQGVAPALLAQCSARLRIPQPGGEESLNVAAAAAVCFYESVRQRPAA